MMFSTNNRGHRRVLRLGLLVALLGGLLTAGACGDEVQVGAPAAPATSAETPVVDPGPTTDAAVTAPPLNYTTSDFVETERNRDPFRSFDEMFRTRQIDAPQREVVMSNTGVDQMKLSAIITGTAQPRAMIVDQFGVGYIVKRGDFVGRAEVAQVEGGSALPLTFNWRVERIRGFENGGVSEVVLTREDPAAPDGTPISRVIPLHDPETER